MKIERGSGDIKTLSVYFGKFCIDFVLNLRNWSTPHIHIASCAGDLMLNFSALCVSIDITYGYTWEQYHEDKYLYE